MPAELLAYAQRHLSPSGTISALFAGTAYRVPRAVTAAALRTLATELLPDRALSIETFGNRVTATAARRGKPARLVRGVTIDFHSKDAEVMVTLSAEPQPERVCTRDES